jgi:hypothetical protein
MTIGETCGKEVLTGNTFCTSCGGVIDPPTGNYRPADARVQAGRPADLLNGNRKIPLITNPCLVRQCIFIPPGIAIVTGGFLSIITGGEWDLPLLFLILSAGLSVLMLLIMIVLQLVTGGGLETEFFYQ